MRPGVKMVKVELTVAEFLDVKVSEKPALRCAIIALAFT